MSYEFRWVGQRNNTGTTNIAWDRRHRTWCRVRLTPASRYMGVTRTTGIPKGAA